MRYWYVSSSDLQLPQASHTVSHQRATSPATPRFEPNRASRRHLKKNYGQAIPQWTWTRSASPKTGAALADLVNGIARAGNSWATKFGLRRSIEALEPKVKQVLERTRDAAGVLIVAKVMEWEQRDFTGARASSPLSAAIASPGLTPIDAMRRWNQINQQVGVISKGAPKGWVAHELYFWATS